MPTLNDAIDFCVKIEGFAPGCGCHVALTGGTLYKDGDRKDIDILFYRIRQVEQINYERLFYLLESELNIVVSASFGWVTKAVEVDKGISFDFFFPEAEGAPNDYEDSKQQGPSLFEKMIGELDE